MPKRKRKTDMENAIGTVMGFANLVDALFVKYSGKTLGECNDNGMTSFFCLVGLFYLYWVF